MAGRVTDATARLRTRRTRQRRRRGLVVVAWLLGVTALLSGAIYLFYGSPAFVARQVRVDGTSLLSVQQVKQVARVPREPLVRVDRQAIADRVATMPEIGSVRVRVRFPSTVVIEVIERTPVVQRINGSSYEWVDAQGVVFHRRDEALPKVVVVETPTADARLLRDAGTIAESLTPTLAGRTTRLEASSPDTFTLVLTKGQKVIWGSAADSATKAQVATAMLGVKATVYDVTSPSTPTSR